MSQSGTTGQGEYLLITTKLNGGTASIEVDNGIGYVAVPLTTDGVQTMYMSRCRWRVVTTGAAQVGVS